MSKRGLPQGMTMRHDWHYVEEISKPQQKTVGKILPLDKIEPNPDQPRTEIGDLTDLTASIQEKGVLEPLLVKPLGVEGEANKNPEQWMIIAGERRWRAARAAGLKEIPCIELDVDERQIAEIALVENLQRKDLTVWEEADGLQALAQRFGYTHEDLARRIGKSRSTVTESLTIASLPPSIREQCAAAGINSKSTILNVARQFDEELMLQAIKNLSTPAVENETKNQANESKTAQTDSQSNAPKEEMTNLSAPVRSYSYQPSQGDFKLALKFKKPVDRSGIINILKQIINDLENN